MRYEEHGPGSYSANPQQNWDSRLPHSAGVANKYLGLGGLNRNLALTVLDAGNSKDPFPSVHSLCLCSSS